MVLNSVGAHKQSSIVQSTGKGTCRTAGTGSREHGTEGSPEWD